ncbi:hypothetical protein [Ensifer soli]|uniref:hypothetical protein n=1 Tax=Ciceribacter sp. sgz301302 TaxID=3342379 RepID=UPI0035B8E889
MTTRVPNIKTLMQGILSAAECQVETAMDAVQTSAADLARLVGPLAAAHQMATIALDLMAIAEREGEER